MLTGIVSSRRGACVSERRWQRPRRTSPELEAEEVAQGAQRALGDLLRLWEHGRAPDLHAVLGRARRCRQSGPGGGWTRRPSRPGRWGRGARWSHRLDRPGRSCGGARPPRGSGAASRTSSTRPRPARGGSAPAAIGSPCPEITGASWAPATAARQPFQAERSRPMVASRRSTSGRSSARRRSRSAGSRGGRFSCRELRRWTCLRSPRRRPSGMSPFAPLGVRAMRRRSPLAAHDLVAVDRAEVRLKVRVHPQERQHPAVGPRRVRLEVVLEQHEELLRRERLLEAGDLLAEPGDPAVLQRLGQRGVRRQAPARGAVGLGGEGLVEGGQILVAQAVEPELRVQRVHHAHRLAEHDDDPRLRIVGVDLGGGALGVEVPDGRLAPAAGLGRRVGEVLEVALPGQAVAPGEVQVAAEVVGGPCARRRRPPGGPPGSGSSRWCRTSAPRR